MVLAQVTVECKECGNPFVVQKECQTRLDAENAERKLRRRKTCPDCYKKQQGQRSLKRVEKMNLPEITGSEKQIAFAFSLRDRYITKNMAQIALARSKLQKIEPQALAEAARENGMSEKRCVEKAFWDIGLYREYLCLAESNARILIDNLR